MNPEIKIAEPQLSGTALPVETPDLLAREEEVSGRAFRGGDISGLACEHLAVTGCSFTGCRLSGVVWRHAHLADVVFRNCDLSVADLTGAGLFRVRFIDCRLSGASLSEASLQHVAAERCRAEYAGFAQRSAFGSHFEIHTSVRVKTMRFYKVYCTFSCRQPCFVLFYIIICIGTDKSKSSLEPH